jgi:hypothetical protein
LIFIPSTLVAFFTILSIGMTTTYRRTKITIVEYFNGGVWVNGNKARTIPWSYLLFDRE